MRGLISCVGNPYPLFAMATQSHLSTQPCLISEKEKLNSGGVALSLLDYTANHLHKCALCVKRPTLTLIRGYFSLYFYAFTSTIFRLLFRSPQNSNDYCNHHDNLFHSLQFCNTLVQANLHYFSKQHDFFHHVHNHCYN